MSAPAPTDPAELVFIGGTGRSGTHIHSYRLDRHAHFHGVPIECRFHCNPKGLADVVAGRTEPEEFLRKLRGYWWHRVRIGDRAYVRAKWRAARAGRRRGPRPTAAPPALAPPAAPLGRAPSAGPRARPRPPSSDPPPPASSPAAGP